MARDTWDEEGAMRSDQRRLLGEMHVCLKPGGKLLLSFSINGFASAQSIRVCSNAVPLRLEQARNQRRVARK